MLSKMSTVERKLFAFTLTLLATTVAHASHPRQNLQSSVRVKDREFVAARPDSRGLRFARQVLPASPTAVTHDQRATSRVIYLNPNGVVLYPGDNDSSTQHSSIVTEPTEITPWDIDQDTWDETVSCVQNMYAQFDVTITDVDPGATPHIEAVFGGHPNDVGLDDNVAGISPFRTDCGNIERSIVFTFTDVLPDDPQLMCEIMSQEIAHSFGLDHQMLASDPMSYLDYSGNRTFKNTMASCGEFEDRDCGINGSVCRDGQNSVAVLTSRLGLRNAEDNAQSEDPTTTAEPGAGCSASAPGSGGPLTFVLIGSVVIVLRRRRRAN